MYKAQKGAFEGRGLGPIGEENGPQIDVKIANLLGVSSFVWAPLHFKLADPTQLWLVGVGVDFRFPHHMKK